MAAVKDCLFKMLLSLFHLARMVDQGGRPETRSYGKQSAKENSRSRHKLNFLKTGTQTVDAGVVF